MGKNNRQRRAAKKKKREATRRHRSADHGRSENRNEPHDYAPPPSDPEMAADLVDFLVSGHGDEATEAKARELLIAMESRTVEAAFEAVFQRLLHWLWGNNWLPGEVIRQVRRSTSAAGAGLMAAAIAADHARHLPDSIHPRWRQHLDGLGLPDVPGRRWLLPDITATTPRVDDLVDLAVQVIQAADVGAVLDPIIPAPGTAAAERPDLADRQPTADPILDKVRGLLAQAESTDFDAEAEAFTAKAHEIMARHSLDEALVWASSGTGNRPDVIRIAIDDPYVDAKSYLLQIVAENTNCRSVFFEQLALSTVVGFEADLRHTDALFTSLLLQAQQSLRRAATAAPPGARTRSRSYRSSFLVAYAGRIDERLKEINRQVRDDVSESSEVDVLPVLASRSMAIDDDVERRFGRLLSSPIAPGRDVAGYVAGRQAADSAELNKAVPIGS